MKLWYLAHPVAGDEHRTLEENLEHVLLVQKILWYEGIKAINPWYTYVRNFGQLSPQAVGPFLEMDIEVVKRCDGLVLAGHKLSRGMQFEYNAHEGLVIDLIAVPDDKLVEVIKAQHEELTLARSFDVGE